MADETSATSVIAKGTTFTGTVKSGGPITVSGTLEGELDAPELEIAEGGVVSGRIKVERLRSAGEIAGQVEAGHLTLAGRVRDDTTIRAREIEVKLSSGDKAPLALSFGNARVEVGERPRDDGSKGDAGGGGGNGGKGQKR